MVSAGLGLVRIMRNRKVQQRRTERPELAPLAHDRVEEAEREDYRLELGLLGRILPDGLVEHQVGALQVGLEPRRRLVGQLDRL